MFHRYAPMIDSSSCPPYDVYSTLQTKLVSISGYEQGDKDTFNGYEVLFLTCFPTVW